MASGQVDHLCVSVMCANGLARIVLKVAFSIEPLVNGDVTCKEWCTSSESECSMLVSAQTDRSVLRKNAPRTDNRKRRINLLTGRDRVDHYALKIETELQLGNCSL
jgi:hypothetical protein